MDSTIVEEDEILIEPDKIRACRRSDQKKEPRAACGKTTQTLEDLPGPKGLPIVGSLFQFNQKKPHIVLERWCKLFGPIFVFKILKIPILVIAKPDLSDKILCDRPETFRKLSSIETVLDELGINGVLSAEGQSWRRLRHLVRQSLDGRHLRQFFPTLVEVTQRLKTRLERPANQGKAVDVHKDIMRYTVDVTTNLVFGYDMNTLENETNVLQQHLEKILSIVYRRSGAPFPYWRLLPSNRKLETALREIQRAVATFIKQSREQLSQNPALALKPSNLLEAMLATLDDSETGFRDEEVFGNAVHMLISGEDTTASTISWIIHFMTEHPEVQRKMQHEADTVLGCADVLNDFSMLKDLSYIEAVTKETMRFKPAAPILALEANVDTEVGGVQIPKATNIILAFRDASLSESHFSSADKFEPARWLPDRPSGYTHDSKSIFPFGSGPRLCPGRSLALMEIKAAMAMFCRNFDISKVKGEGPIDETLTFTMMPTNLHVVFKERTKLEGKCHERFQSRS